MIFFKSIIVKWCRHEAKREPIAATATFHYQHCHFLARLWFTCTHALGWIMETRQWASFPLYPESLPQYINIASFNQGPLHLCMGYLIFFFKDGQLWIGWNLFFRLWAECMFPFNNYTERLKFQKEVCWGLWVIKMEYFYPVTSSWPPYTHTSSSYWYLSHVKILLLDS